MYLRFILVCSDVSGLKKLFSPAFRFVFIRENIFNSALLPHSVGYYLEYCWGFSNVHGDT